MAPGSRVPKTYHVNLQGAPDPSSLSRLRRGVVLEGRKTLPARVRSLRPGRNPWIEITIVEGRNRQIRRMCEAVGHRVVKLRRVRLGPLELGRMTPGECRPVTSRELRELRRAAGFPGQPEGQRRTRPDRP